MFKNLLTTEKPQNDTKPGVRRIDFGRPQSPVFKVITQKHELTVIFVIKKSSE